MQPVKLVALYDDKKRPTHYSNVIEFTTLKDLDTFKKTCDENLKVHIQEKEQKEKEFKNMINQVMGDHDKIFKLLAYLLYELNIDKGVIKADEKEESILDNVLNGTNDLPNDYVELLKKIDKGVK